MYSPFPKWVHLLAWTLNFLFMFSTAHWAVRLFLNLPVALLNLWIWWRWKPMP